jgi:hypothetical protein
MALLGLAGSLTASVCRGEPMISHSACSAVVLKPSELPIDPREAQKMLLQTQWVLEQRLMEVGEKGLFANSLGVSLDGDRFVLDAPSMTCEQVTEMGTALAERTNFELGLVGERPAFTEEDLDLQAEATEGLIRLRFRSEARMRFKDFTAENLGREVFIRLGESHVIHMPVEAEQTSGIIVLQARSLSDDALPWRTLLPVSLSVSECVTCLGTYN